MPMPESLRDKYQYYTCADITKLQQAGFREPLTSIEDGIKEYVQRYLSSPNPYLDDKEPTSNL
jgi:ADP-L-glycero-D-manno-heptose 6-epimerase